MAHEKLVEALKRGLEIDDIKINEWGRDELTIQVRCSLHELEIWARRPGRPPSGGTLEELLDAYKIEYHTSGNYVVFTMVSQLCGRSLGSYHIQRR